ncbi:hypothetical protein F5883DRAFT_579735 [Diaporthe sp. PMI_573]|nr:hypothetical protein F5883DRAFT_579735 [Diaporthaceae sp. PMI_573]
MPLQHQPTASQAKNSSSVSNTGNFSSVELSSSPEGGKKQRVYSSSCPELPTDSGDETLDHGSNRRRSDALPSSKENSPIPGSGHVPRGQISNPTADPGVDDQRRQRSIIPQNAPPPESAAKVSDVSTAQPEEPQNIAHPTISPKPTTSEINTSHYKDGFFNGVINPVPGDIYQAFYKDAYNEGWWMCTPLPWDAWERHIGIKFSIWQANLFRDLPDCYRISRVRTQAKGRKMKPVITGWNEGFGEDGPRVNERVFPVLFFDDKPGEPGSFTFPPPEKAFTFSKQALKALPAEWVAAADLRLPHVDVGQPVAGGETAARFRERVQALREAQDEKKSTAATNSKSNLSSPVAGVPAARENIAASAHSVRTGTKRTRSSPVSPENPSSKRLRVVADESWWFKRCYDQAMATWQMWRNGI